MTAPTMSPDIATETAEELQPACDIFNYYAPDGQCDQPAAWYGIMTCCDAVRLICESHRPVMMVSQWYSCKVCETYLNMVVPLKRAERL